MSSVVPVNPSLVDLRPTSRGLTIIPRTGSASRTSSRYSQRRDSLKSDSASSVQSVADETLTLEDIEVMLYQKVQVRREDLKAAFRAFDQEDTGTVTKGEFRRVVEGFLVPLTQSQFEALFAKVPRKTNGTVLYVDFLQQYCKVSSAPISYRISSVSRSHRGWPLGELQCRLKDKIGSNLKNITRAFRLFDYNHDGQIQHHELRRVLESYCFPLSKQEFHRLWSHYSPNNSRTISYKEFLERLGTDCENYRKVAPDSAKLALTWDAVNHSNTRPRSRTTAWTGSAETENTLDEIHAKFLKQMNINHALVEKTLQAFDTADSGVVTYSDLKAILSSFLFPISDSTFLSLLSRFGLNPPQPVEWRKFISLFKKEEQISPAGKGTRPANPDPSSIEKVLPSLQRQIIENYSLLKRAFLIFDENRTGMVTTGELRRVLEDLTFSLTDEQFRGLMKLLHVSNSGAISYQHLLNFFQQRKSVEPQDDNSTQTQCTSPSPIAIKAWPAVEGLLKEKLSEHCDSLMESLRQTDTMQNCTVPAEDLRRLIQQYGLALSDSHFAKLCEPFMESGAVNYRLLMMSLGISKSNGMQIGSAKGHRLAERNEKVNIESVKRRAVVDVVLRRIRDRLQKRGVTLQHCLMGTSRGSRAVLSLRDFQKILDDCRISLTAPQFRNLIQYFGFCDGQISITDFVAKYKEVVSEESNEEEKRNVITVETLRDMSVMSAEDCLSQLEKRIKEHHGDILTAFYLMDVNRDGLVNQDDFKVLFDTLMFVTEENEYHKLLELLGFKPDSTLNYAEFFRKIRSIGGTRTHLDADVISDQLLHHACEQVHAYLVASARTGWSEFSKDLFQYGADGERLVTKNDLHHLLCKYYLPITPREFEKIWTRYSEDGKDHITQTEFLDKLNITQKELIKTEPPVEQRLSRSPCVTPLLEITINDLRDWLKLNFEDVSRSLVALDKKRDGHVAVTDLLSLLHQYDLQIEERTLLSLIKNLGLDVCQSKLSYLDFLKHAIGLRLDSRGSPAPSQSARPKSASPVPGEISFERALQRTRELVTTSSDTLSKAFTVFDKTGNGKISQTEFRRVLDHFCVKLTDVQFRRLLAKLSIQQGDETVVDWKKFLQTFNLQYQETSNEWLEKINKVRFPNQTRPLPVHDILGRIQEVVSARLYTITKEMVDLDYAGINTISKEDFKIICGHHFMRLTDDQFEKLWKVLPVNPFGNLDYREFLKKFGGELREMEKPGESPSPGPVGPSESSADVPPQRPKTASCITARSKSLNLEQPKRPSTVCGRISLTPQLDLESVERRLRSQIRNCWREIQRRCWEADNSRSGEIDVKLFLDILGDLHIDLTQAQIEQLSEKYDIRSKGRLSYPEFLQHFVLMLRPQTQTYTGRRKLHTPRTPMNAGPLSRHCKDSLLRLCAPVQLSWRPMRRAFVSHDKERKGKVSLQFFRKVLRQYNIHLSEEDFFHLTSYFDKDISGEISYNDFLRIFQK